jgi:hypothetical protein
VLAVSAVFFHGGIFGGRTEGAHGVSVDERRLGGDLTVLLGAFSVFSTEFIVCPFPLLHLPDMTDHTYDEHHLHHAHLHMKGRIVAKSSGPWQYNCTYPLVDFGKPGLTKDMYIRRRLREVPSRSTIQKISKNR